MPRMSVRLNLPVQTTRENAPLFRDLHRALANPFGGPAAPRGATAPNDATGHFSFRPVVSDGGVAPPGTPSVSFAACGPAALSIGPDADAGGA